MKFREPENATKYEVGTNLLYTIPATTAKGQSFQKLIAMYSFDGNTQALAWAHKDYYL